MSEINIEAPAADEATGARTDSVIAPIDFVEKFRAIGVTFDPTADIMSLIGATVSTPVIATAQCFSAGSAPDADADGNIQLSACDYTGFFMVLKLPSGAMFHIPSGLRVTGLQDAWKSGIFDAGTPDDVAWDRVSSVVSRILAEHFQ